MIGDIIFALGVYISVLLIGKLISDISGAARPDGDKENKRHP